MNPVEISTEQFRRLAERVTTLAADYLENIDGRGNFSGNDWRRNAPPVQCRACRQDGIGEDALNALPEVMQFSRVQNGRFFGYVLGSGEPVGAVADLLASVINQNVTAWRSGPAAVVIEQTVVNWLGAGDRDLPASLAAISRAARSSANLMALAAGSRKPRRPLMRGNRVRWSCLCL